MSVSDNKALTRRFYDEGINFGLLAEMDRPVPASAFIMPVLIRKIRTNIRQRMYFLCLLLHVGVS